MSEERFALLPCPFCGDAARAWNIGGVQVACDGCGARSGLWTTTKAAADAWNKRIGEGEAGRKLLDLVDAVLEEKGVKT